MNKTVCNICLECFPTVEIDRIEEGMTGREVADLLYDNFDKLNQGKADRCVEHTVDNILRDQYNIHNSTAKQKFINEVFYTFAKQDVKDSLADFKELKDNLHDHLVDYTNPHKVTKDLVGLDQVDNTSDKDKPISDAVATAIDELYEAIDAVDERRIDYTVNGYKINTNPILDGNDIELDNYTKVSVDTAIDNDDTVTKAIGKLEYRLEEEVGDRVDALEQEIAARIAADEALSNDITEETHNRIDADNQLQLNINNEATARQQADTQLQLNIDDLSDSVDANVTQLDSKIDLEIADRQAGDNQLTENIATLGLNLTSSIQEVANNLATHATDTNNPHQVTKEQVGLGNVTNDVQVKRSEMGVANGVATLNESGQVPSTLLPSYVDDVLEYDTFTSLPDTGETGKIYITLDDNLTYRWSGTQYVEISKSLALGETSSTAFPGNRGKAVEDITNSLPLNITFGLNRNAVTNNDSVLVSYEYKTKQGDGTYSVMSSTAACTIPAATTTTAGVMSAVDKIKLDNLNSVVFDFDELTAAYTTPNVELYNDIVKAYSSKLQPVVLYDSGTQQEYYPGTISVYLGPSGSRIYYLEVDRTDVSLERFGTWNFSIGSTGAVTYGDNILDLSYLNTDGDGTKYLADDGTYKTIDLTSLDDKYLPLTGGTISDSTSNNIIDVTPLDGVHIEYRGSGSYTELDGTSLIIHNGYSDGDMSLTRNNLTLRRGGDGDDSGSVIIQANSSTYVNPIVLATSRPGDGTVYSLQIGYNGIMLSNKTDSDLLNANGGTTTLKTINGQSLIGTGDITIEGGTDTYVLPIASDTTLGGIKIGTGLNISEDGTVTVNIPTDYVTNSTLTTTLQSYETTQHASDTYQVKGDYVTTDLLTSLINRITALEQALTLKNV